MENEVKPTHKEVLECRAKRVEIIDKIELTKQRRLKEEIDLKIKETELERKKAGSDNWNHPIAILLNVAGAYIIDNDKCTTTEYALRSMWDEEALNFIRKRIMKKVKEL